MAKIMWEDISCHYVASFHLIFIFIYGKVMSRDVPVHNMILAKCRETLNREKREVLRILGHPALGLSSLDL